MALDINTLGNLIKSYVDSDLAGVAPSDPTYPTKFYTAIAKAVVQHITGAAVVNPGTLKDSTNATITGSGTIS